MAIVRVILFIIEKVLMYRFFKLLNLKDNDIANSLASLANHGLQHAK